MIAALPSPSTTLFAARGLTKRYRLGRVPVPALRGVDLEVERGEVLALAGPSGSGKTTLLNLLGGLDVPDEGTVALAGRDLGALSEGERTLLRRRHLGFVFQTFNLVPVLSAYENVEYPLWIAGTPAAERRRRTTAALAAVGLAERSRHRPDQLSGGERQRVAVARALVHEPLALLADEPTGNLDSVTGQQVLELLLEHNRRSGATLVIATHDPAILARMPRRVRLRDGLVIGDERGPAEAAP
ncbi:MAG TPA: ABC transporter ATP-binding protein [Thermoanaerobaculia bacterium]|jgi:putative ABC transport system ATP-binding protein|nr:ABC transporter ATP-binding protein [Thermoanaerobaculia bacterium]